MTDWNHQFWHAIILAGIIVLAMLPGAVGALFMKIVAMSTSNSTSKIVSAINTCAIACVHFYVKTAQWVGSMALVLLIIGIVGRFGMYTMIHWREIWGP